MVQEALLGVNPSMMRTRKRDACRSNKDATVVLPRRRYISPAQKGQMIESIIVKVVLPTTEIDKDGSHGQYLQLLIHANAFSQIRGMQIGICLAIKSYHRNRGQFKAHYENATLALNVQALGCRSDQEGQALVNGLPRNKPAKMYWMIKLRTRLGARHQVLRNLTKSTLVSFDQLSRPQIQPRTSALSWLFCVLALDAALSRGPTTNTIDVLGIKHGSDSTNTQCWHAHMKSIDLVEAACYVARLPEQGASSISSCAVEEAILSEELGDRHIRFSTD